MILGLEMKGFGMAAGNMMKVSRVAAAEDCTVKDTRASSSIRFPGVAVGEI